MSLDALYALIVKKRPELAVVIDRGEGCTQRLVYVHGGWQLETYYDETRQCVDFVIEEIASAMILSRWLRALPNDASLRHWDACERAPEMWFVMPTPHDYEPSRPTPLEALAVYWIDKKK